MNTFLDWGIPILTAFQGLADWLQPIMNAFTILGDELGYLVIMPFILWSVDYGLGLRFGTIVLSSSALNSMLKWTFSLPRPYWVDARVEGFLNATSFGFPSGHAQSAVVAWGRIIVWVKKRWAYLALGALILLISISRWYLGVHYPSDTLGGWIFGLCLLWAFVKLEEPVIRFLKRQSVWRQIVWVFLASVVLLGLGFGVLAATQNKALPDSWETAAMANVLDSDEAFEPRDPASIVTAAGAIFGTGAGALLLYQWNQFSTAGPWLQRIGRYFVGLIGMVAIYAGLKAVFPSGTDPIALLLRYIRYALVGIWGSYLAPRLFVAIGLADGSSATTAS
jgi:membrane-associated phospholipid phosphatase